MTLHIDDDIPTLLDASGEPGPSSYERDKVPITLLTGYLGAGKSTLLEYILTANHGYRIAVCMNDFGDTTDIEAKALTLSNPDDNTRTSSMLSLPNGCLCCSVKDMGIAAIEEMVAAQRDKVDWVLVELTGVADPGPIAKTFWENEEMGDLILDGIICVVDSRNILNQLSEKREEGNINEAQKQLAASDVILLNKLDLVNPSQIEEVEATVRRINPTLRLYKTTKSQIDLKNLFDLRAYSAIPTFTTVVSENEHGEDSHECKEGCSHGVHSTGITTVLIPLPPLSMEKYDRLNFFLESLLWNRALPKTKDSEDTSPVPEILRTKGLINLDDGREMVLQGVTDLFELKEASKGNAGEGKVDGKVVFIGRGVDDRLRRDMLQYINE